MEKRRQYKCTCTVKLTTEKEHFAVSHLELKTVIEHDFCTYNT